MEEVKYGDVDRMENVIKVVGMKNDVKGGIKDVEDSIIVNNSVSRDCRMLFLVEGMV